MSRVLILTASVGEGHDLPARLLAERLRAEHADAEVVIEDGLRAMGRAFVLVNERAPRVVFHRLRWLWDAAFWICVRARSSRRFTRRLVYAFGAGGVLRLIERVSPDVVVSVYPMTTEVLGALRRSGKLEIPTVAVITDLAMMHYWAAPGIDLHLVTHVESTDEVRDVAGREARVVAVKGLVRPEFESHRDHDEARVALRLPLDARVALVSGGGWGVGDLTGAIDAALEVDDALVVCLTGRNETVRVRIEERYADESRVTVVGFTEQMGDWLAAADVLVHSTGGLTVLEAAIRGCPTISYGWGRGHIRANNEAFSRHGFADVVSRRDELQGAIARAFAGGRRHSLPVAKLPSAAALVIALLA
ncbi:MAG TPA: glycosyltransferase [Gaiellaceae bacterium]|nr:glycosyltransferase [Gaiellaceae bacterium]